jgi:hypothetical protein
MRTRKARIVLRDTTIEITDVTDEDWAECLRLDEQWQAGRAGGIDFHHSDPSMPSPMTFDYSDIVGIEMWPGSEKPR